jgi:hypothetical protein
MLIMFDIIETQNDSYIYFFFFILVNNQKTIENQLGIHITDSGIGNPRRVRDRDINKKICKWNSRLNEE